MAFAVGERLFLSIMEAKPLFWLTFNRIGGVIIIRVIKIRIALKFK